MSHVLCHVRCRGSEVGVNGASLVLGAKQHREPCPGRSLRWLELCLLFLPCSKGAEVQPA